MQTKIVSRPVPPVPPAEIKARFGFEDLRALLPPALWLAGLAPAEIDAVLQKHELLEGLQPPAQDLVERLDPARMLEALDARAALELLTDDQLAVHFAPWEVHALRHPGRNYSEARELSTEDLAQRDADREAAEARVTERAPYAHREPRRTAFAVVLTEDPEGDLLDAIGDTLDTLQKEVRHLLEVAGVDALPETQRLFEAIDQVKAAHPKAADPPA